MSNKQHARKQRIPAMPVIDAQVVEAPVLPEVKPSLFARVKARVKTFFSRGNAQAVAAKGRTLWSKLWSAVKSLTQRTVVPPAKAVGGFIARVARKIAAFGRKVAATRAFQAAHRFVRGVLAGTLLAAWITTFLTFPLMTVVYTLGVYVLGEVVGAGLLKLRDLREQGSRAAEVTLLVLNMTAKGLYVGMQIAMAALLIVTAVAAPAFGILMVGIYGVGLWFEVRESAFEPRWKPGVCEACSENRLINAAGICLACKKLQVEEDTHPFVQDHGTPAAVVG